VTLGISTDHAAYKAGSTLSGTVYVSIQKAQTGGGMSQQTLNLELIGEEHAVIHHRTTEEHRTGSGSNDRVRRDQDHFENSTFSFFQVQVPLAYVETGQVARYEFPFSLTLPKTLPSSMKAQHQGQSYCEIRYRLKATLGTSSGLFSSPPHAEKLLSIMASPSPSSNGTQDPGLTSPREYVPVMGCCCCCSQGTMMLEASSNRSILAPAQTCQVDFCAKNLSKQKVKNVEVSLVQVLEWNVNGRNEKIRRTLDRRQMDAKTMPELAKARRHKRQEYFGAPEQQGLAGGSDQRHSVQLQAPVEALDSYAGRAVQVRHQILVTLKTKGCCSTNPQACLRCTIASGSELLAPKPSTSTSQDDPLAAPSAPPSYLDETTGSYSAPTTASVFVDEGADTPQAHATALPKDWEAQTASVVEIPMAQAILLGPAASVPSAPVEEKTFS